ncbi:AIPR family protein [Natronohydrobacter thiooxidans]|uniref:AIPR family protein n=1 Tax=Natronohydrobacter thiooxidans TaxID=87172 RepID=UPI0008FF5350|nr:AIPR family protein [Natronohydrobacter thiooxidans]
MNPVVKAQLQKFSNTNPTQHLKEQDYFELYSIFSLVNGREKENSDPFSIHLQGSEFGIDGCSISIEGRLVLDSDQASEAMSDYRNGRIHFTFIQAKRSDGFDYGEISKFLDAVYFFFTDGMESESNQLDDLIEAKNIIFGSTLRKNPDITCFFASTGSVIESAKIEKLIAASKDKLEQLSMFENIKIEIVGAKELQEGYRAATSANAQEIEFPQNKTMPVHKKVDQAFIGFIEAEQLLKLATTSSVSMDDIRINQSVFFDNIRDYSPTSEINEKIIKELQTGDKSGFVFRNNGVTIVAKKINRTGDKFLIEDFQIVNGCQTCNIIFESRNSINEVFVPLRLIGTNNEDFITSIIVGTNSQNQVKDEQFWALKPFMKDLEEYFAQKPADLQLFLERRENQYRNEAVERTRIVKPADLMKTVAAMYLFQPHRAARDFRGIRKEFSGKLFTSGHNVTAYHAAAFSAYKFDYLVRNKKLPRSINIHKYYILARLGFENSKGGKILSLSGKKVNLACDKIFELARDDANFAKYCTTVSNDIDKLLNKKLGNSPANLPRERIRDTLRSESFAKDFLY